MHAARLDKIFLVRWILRNKRIDTTAEKLSEVINTFFVLFIKLLTATKRHHLMINRDRRVLL